MANDILTNEEIDALLALFAGEGIPEDLLESSDIGRSGVFDGTVTEIDLLKPNRLSRDQIVILERIQRGVADKMGSLFADRLRVEAACDSVAVEQMRYSTWVRSVDHEVTVYVVEFAPIEVPAIITISTRLLFGVVDKVLGGSAMLLEDGSTVRRELSEAEHAVADAIVMPLLEAIAGGVSELVDVEAKVLARFSHVSMAQAIPFQEVVVASHFQFSGQPLLGDVRCALAYSGIEPYLNRLATSRYGGSRAGQVSEYREFLREQVRPIELELGVELGRCSMRLFDLMALGVGDVVPLDTRVGTTVDVPIEGNTKFRGVIGSQGPRYAVRIEEVIEGLRKEE